MLRMKQREEYMKSTDPQCYQHIATDEDEETDEGLESKQLISNQDYAGGNYLNKQRLSIEPNMRVSFYMGKMVGLAISQAIYLFFIKMYRDCFSLFWNIAILLEERKNTLQ